MVLDKFRLEDKICVITGGAGLLGTKHAEAVLEAGARVLLLDINSEALKKTESILDSSKCRSLVCDITKEENVRSALDFCIKTFNSPADILINNAAIDPKIKKNEEKNFSRLENFSIEQWNMEISVGLTGAMLCTKIFGYEMAKKQSGVILNIASDLGLIAPDQRLYKKEGLADSEQNVKPVTYSVIKHGLLGLTKYVATYWANQGVRCNSFAPAGVFNNQPDDFVQRISQLIPMGRMAHSDEYKAAIVFMCSDASSYMNGATLVFDGGRSVL